MSQQSRPTQGGIPAYVPSGIMPAVRMNSSQFVYNQPLRMPYNITTVPATQHFVPTTIVYPNQLTVGAPGNVSPGMQRFYVPVQQLPVHTYNPISLGQRAPADPVMLEEQRKLEKDRNFQMQQQRLKQFTIAGKKGSLNADNLLDSMFGKPDSKRQTTNSPQPNKPIQQKESSINPVSRAAEHPMPVLTTSVVVVRQDDFPIKSRESKTKEKAQKDPKELENMMIKCSNFSGPQKAKLFQKPAVKEMPKSSPRSTTFSPSEKAVDWRSIQGLDNVFMAPKPRFPAWCRRESVPPMFLQVQSIVTGNDSHPPETQVLYPILISSGLPQTVLGEIWEMVNQTSPGCLTAEEMYAALALIAIAQAGYRIKSADILHQFPTCPVPNLQYFNASQNSNTMSAPSSSHDVPVSADPTKDGHPELVQNNAVPSVRPSSLPTSSENISSSFSSWSPFSKNDEQTDGGDDDFDDFKSHTPMAVNAPPLVENSSTCDDEFDDFKQAPGASSSFATFPKLEKMPSSNSTSQSPHIVGSDLMLPEDKYSVFRMLQQDSCSEAETEEASSINANNVQSSGLFTEITEGDESLLIREQGSTCDSVPSQPASMKIDSAEEEFGDFLDASNTPVPSPLPTRLKPVQSQPFAFTEDFADFSHLNNAVAAEAHTLKTDAQSSPKSPSGDNDFGEFTAFQKSTLKPDAILDHFSSSSKDNISLAESQSISSLEFGTFDMIGHGSDLKTSLSRQGSIPSLDLKVPGLEAAENEDEFGDMQSAGSGTNVSPSPSLDINKPSEEKPQPPISGLTMQPPLNISLADKYSVIRSEHVINEDQHISDWTRCIQSSLEILQNATKIFNQMSCSSVCNEVLGTEEGKNYVKNVIEVYKVVCRIALASKSYEKQDGKLLQLFKDSDQAFNTFSVFLAGSPLLPDEASLDFTSGVLRADSDNNEKACGVCLLNVDSHSKAFNKKDDSAKLTYGRRQYHCTCANLWVNCVDPLLPMLTLPQLI